MRYMTLGHLFCQGNTFYKDHKEIIESNKESVVTVTTKIRIIVQIDSIIMIIPYVRNSDEYLISL